MEGSDEWEGTSCLSAPSPSADRAGPGPEWDTLLVTENRTCCRCDLLAQHWGSPTRHNTLGLPTLVFPWRQMVTCLGAHRAIPEPLRKTILTAAFIQLFLWVRCWVKHFPGTVHYGLHNNSTSVPSTVL